MELGSLHDAEPESGVPGHELDGARTWWLASDDTTGAEMGAFAVTEYDPGVREELHAHPGCETVKFLLEGEGTHLSTHRSIPMREWDAVYLSPGEAHGFHNDSDEPARLVTVFGGAASAEAAGYEAHDGGAAETAPRLVSGPDEIDTHEFGGLPEEFGLRNMGSYWYVTGDLLACEEISLGISRFEVGGGHFGLHKHDAGEEFFLVMDGGGTHKLADDEIGCDPGGFVYTPVDEQHGWVNGEEGATHALFGWFGAAGVEESGYEQTELAGEGED